LKFNDRIDVDLARFLRWWGGELASLTPERLRKFLVVKRACLILSEAAEGVEAIHLDGNEPRALGAFTLDEEGARKRAALFQDAPHLAEAELIVRLDPGQSLCRTVKLPAAAEENLRQVMGFEMDRWTPFKAEQVYFSHRLLERLSETRQIRLELALTPRAGLDEWLDELALCGWRPGRVDIGPETEGRGHDLLPERFRPPKNRLPRLLTIASATLLAGLAFCVCALPILMSDAQEEDLRRELKAATKIAKEVDALRESAEKQAQQALFLLKKKRLEPAMVDMLEELSKLIPDQTSLNGLQYRDRRVVMQGQSPAASSLIEVLEASPYFKNTNFVSPVTKDVSSGQERFQIASEVVNGRALENKPE
jgi:general secretion pathway protein L